MMSRFLLLNLLAGIAGGLLAERKGRSPILWGLICFFFPPSLIVIIFLPQALPRNRGGTHPGQGAGRVRGEGEKGKTGKNAVELVECRACGTYVPRDHYCARCGRPL